MSVSLNQPLKLPLNQIVHGDCVEQMNRLPAGQVDLAFADPPFNIGYRYDVYDDSVEHQQYLDWSRQWIAAVHRVLKPDGTFWLAIGDEYAAELKIISQEVGFHCRSWVIWYYTFGVNCSRKFTRSHAHLFHFVKDPQQFTFCEDDLDNRVPSARELVYNDRRANPAGRLPDDTWLIRPPGMAGQMVVDDNNTFVLRPQELQQSFAAGEDTWCIPRVAGTFKERAGFHGCQMPEQLLGRILRVCSEPDELVLDPFSGSATTLAVAKKLGRSYCGFDLSEEYVQHGRQRLEAIAVGDRLDGSPEPLKTTPSEASQRRGKKSKGSAAEAARRQRVAATEQRYAQTQLDLTARGVRQAFQETHSGFSIDRVVADPDLNQRFIAACRERSLVGQPWTWNKRLFELRKDGHLADVAIEKWSTIDWQACDRYAYASEIAMQQIFNEDLADSLDDLFCDPQLAADFDQRAARLAPGFQPFEYRWTALQLRAAAQVARTRAAALVPPQRLGAKLPLGEVRGDDFAPESAVYVLSDEQQVWYVGETLDLQARVHLQFGEAQKSVWQALASPLFIQTVELETAGKNRLAWQSCLVKQNGERPPWNYFELA